MIPGSDYGFRRTPMIDLLDNLSEELIAASLLNDEIDYE
jgi:hypothetical protein